MAIEFKKILAIREKLNERPFDNDEIAALARLETFIDNKIMANVDSNSCSILLTLAEFNYNPNDQKPYDFREERKAQLQKALEKNYKDAEWEVSTHIDDGLDGPNRSGADFWTLTGIWN